MPETIFGLPGAVFLLWTSAAFYIVAIVFFWRPFRKERTELMSAFFAFLMGMAIFHILLGWGLWRNNLLGIHLGIFAALTGAAYTLKFPFSVLPPRAKQTSFYLALLVAWSIVGWMLMYAHEVGMMFKLTLGYMIVTSGGIVGLYMIWRGLKAKELYAKVKAIGGGVGLVTCCLVADLFVLYGGVNVLGEIFMSVAPVILVVAVYAGRVLQKRSETPAAA